MKSVAVVLCVFCFLTLSNDSYAYQGSPFINGGEGYKQQKVKLRVNSSGQAAQLVKSRVGGKVLKVQNKRVSGHVGYKVKILKADGRIISVLVDAETGRIIGR
jgi:uncharacterized membrane protein YkoI